MTFQKLIWHKPHIIYLLTINMTSFNSNILYINVRPLEELSFNLMVQYYI